MNYELEIQKSSPAVFDTLSGTVPPLVAGSGTASLLTGQTSKAFGAFKAGVESQPFSLELWHLPIRVTSEMAVIGHGSEGILWNGTEYILRMNFDDATFIEGRWTPTEVKSRHLVAVYDKTQFSLYADSEKVISVDVPGSVTFLSTSTNIGINGGTGTRNAIYDSLALYYRVLTNDEIKLHYAWGTEAMPFTQIASSKGATTWSLSFGDVDVYDTIVFDSRNWNQGLLTNIASVDPLRSDGAGSWDTMIPLGAIMDSTPGIYVSWVGRGVNVSYSLNGTTWTQLTNRTTIMEDQNLTDVFLLLRIELLDATSYVDSVTLHMLNERIMQPISGVRSLTFKSASMDETPGHQLDYQLDQGATILNGYLQVEPDNSIETPAPVRSIEMWAKSDAPITIGPAVANTYVHGTQGQWSHYVFVLSSNIVGPIRIAEGMTCNIGSLAVYPTVLTEADANNLYLYNVGGSAIRIVDSGSVNMAEGSPTVDVYAYIWSIVSG